MSSGGAPPGEEVSSEGGAGDEEPSTSGGSSGSGTAGASSLVKSFDPGQVYVQALLKGGYFGVALVNNPQHYTEGLEGNSTLAFLGRDIIYKARVFAGALHRYLPDVESYSDPSKIDILRPFLNDPILSTPACPGVDEDAQKRIEPEGVVRFLTGPGERLFYTCGSDQSVWYEGSDVVFQENEQRVIAFGADDAVLIEDSANSQIAVMHLNDGQLYPVPELGALYRVPVRAHDKGFHAAIVDDDRLNDHKPFDLLEIGATGVTTVLGTFPGLPDSVEVHGLKLAADDHVYGLGIERTTAKYNVLRLDISGAVDVIYREDKDTHFIFDTIPGAVVFTGP